MAQNLAQHEIALIEWRRINSIAWPTLSVICALQAIMSEGPTTYWQVLYVTGLGIAAVMSWALSKNQNIQFSATPTVIYLLISPIVLGTQPKNAWLSIGLIIFAAVIYYSAIENPAVAFVTITLLIIFQTLIVRMNLTSITDRLDITYFYSYFSILWLFVMGISSFYIRRRYLEVALSIQTIVDSEISSSLTRLKSLKQINEKDSRNLRLHGTVLNTLIHVRNLLEQNMTIGSSKQTLIDEIRSLASESISIDERNFMAKLELMISNRALKRVEVSLAPFNEVIDSPLLEESCLEIIRELILNTEKHTQATTAALTVNKGAGSSIHITLIDNSISNLPLKEKYQTLEKSKDSRTLQNLLSACGAKIKVSLSKGKKYRKVEVEIPFIDLKIELKTTLAKSRITGLNDFALNFVRASALVALLSLPGYLISGLKPLPLLFTASTVLGLFLVLQFPQSRLLLSFFLISSLLIIPAISRDVESCSELGAIPWLFNHILTVGFFASIHFKNRVAKWLPILILSIECFYYPLHYPPQCQNIFLGSLPGIPLIIIFALSVLAVRRREVHFDEDESYEIARFARVLTSSDAYRETAYTVLLDDLLIFANQLERDPEANFRPETISLQIQKIQTFLICAEHFESELIRRTFELFREKQFQGIPGKLSLLGENFVTVDFEHSLNLIVNGLRGIKADGDASLTIVHTHTLEFHFEGGQVAGKPSSIDGIPVFYG